MTQNHINCKRVAAALALNDDDRTTEDWNEIEKAARLVLSLHDIFGQYVASSIHDA